MATKKPVQSPISEGLVSNAEDVITNSAEITAPEEVQDGSVALSVDFSDEDAAMAADAPEFDLGEENSENEPQVETTGHDLMGMNKQQLVDLLESLLREKPVHNLRRDAEAIKVAFYKLHRTDVEQIRKAFLEADGKAEDFIAPADPTEQKLKDVFGEYRKKRDEYISSLERNKEDNLTVKLKIIEDLKELVNSSETMNHTFQAFRDLQQRWKETGAVPQSNLKDIWETYNLHVENFYSFIKINKELRDLDLKRNLEAKTKLCEEAETLAEEYSVINAFHKLQKLHDEWRETGPVANEHKEVLWERFKEASSKINKHHQEHFEGLKDEQKHNFDLKSELCKKTEALIEAEYGSRKEWNKASDQLIEIQKVWKTIGFAPKKENAKVYERFRNACDKFFEKKRQFYIGFKSDMDGNLRLKNEICEAAEALKDSEDWKKATDELIGLQNKWKEIGPISRRHSDIVWKRFRAACDYFFSRKSNHFSSVDSEYEENLVKKRALLEEIAAYDIASGGFEKIKEFQRRWNEIGYVHIKQKEAIGKQYKELMDKLFATTRGGEKERQMGKFKNKVSNMKGSDDRRIIYERERLYNKVRQLESDIALLENNIGFFSKSKNADSIIKDVQNKITKAKSEIADAIEKINLIDKQE